MKIFEVEDVSKVSPEQLSGLASFLAGRARDTDGPTQIDKNAFLLLVRDLGMNISSEQLIDLVSKPPLANLLEPIDPNSPVIMFKGSEKPDVGMPVNKAQDIVANAAKSAARKDRGV